MAARPGEVGSPEASWKRLRVVRVSKCGTIRGIVRILLSVLIATVLVTAAFALMLDPLIRQMLYPAPPIPVPSPPPAPLEEVALALPSGERAVGWARIREDPASPAAAFFHGNGENLETLRLSGLYDQLAALGMHLLAVEYPGYVPGSGQPSEASLTAAGRAGLDWLAKRHPSSPRLVLGWSLGAAVAIGTAAGADGVDGLVLISAWADLPSLAKTHYPGWLVGLGLSDTYDSVAAAGKIEVPVLMIHGGADEIIPIGEGRRLHRALGDASRFVEVPGAGHNDLLARPVVWEELGTFVREIAGR